MLRLASLVFVLSLAGACAANAAALRVAPVGLDLGEGQNAATLSLRNDGSSLLNVQVRVFKWRQQDGKDVLEPATGVVVSPPISRIDPNGARTIRVVRTDPSPVTSEEAYRILVDELPPPPDESGRTVTLLMRHSIPVFFGVSGRGPDMVWKIDRTADGLALSAANTGLRRVRIADVRLMDGDGEVVAEHHGLIGYVLPGSRMQWPVGQAETAVPAQLSLTTDAGPVNVTLAGQ